MKKIYFILFLAILPFISKAQCFVQVTHQNVTCNSNCDGSATAFPVGQAPYTYSWMPGNMTTASVSGLCAGTYTVTTTDSTGCVATGTFTVTQPNQLILSMASTPASCSSCCDGTATAVVSGGTPPYTYSWAPGGQTTQGITNLCPGTYTCCVTDSHGCLSCITATITFSTGIQDQSVLGNLSVFPNPATEFVTVKESFGVPVSAVISVSNVLGETVYTKSVSATSELNETISVAEFTSGVYFISIKTATGTSVRRFVKE